jgi:putative oxygen-independent coproporphyrinogen III oxidase
MNKMKIIPLSLYIHIPWCVRKCPYCDFNSHAQKEVLPEELYVVALLDDLKQHKTLIAGRNIISIFFGGGTPSLFSGKAIGAILEGAAKELSFAPDIEITLEANPGTVEQSRFRDFLAAGVNRLSLGVQSLQDEKLKQLGRIHSSEEALKAIHAAKHAGFHNFNIDLMHGLPNQSLQDALSDIEKALQCEPTHLSWYQLTIEPNTLFYHQRPTLPPDDTLWAIQEAGVARIEKAGFKQYEVSAYAQPTRQCLHNKNYWKFGDYIGIGAGAHSKLTDASNGNITRYAQVKNPRDYLLAEKRHALKPHLIDSNKDIIFEFMLNALRLTDGIPETLFEERTGLSIETIKPILNAAQEKNFLEKNNSGLIKPSLHGKKFLNDLVEMFL